MPPDGTQELALAAPESTSLLNFVAQAVSDPSIDVGKLEALLRMQREILADDARQQFGRAMTACQAEIQPVVRDTANTQTGSKYAKLEKVDAAIRPIYTRHGFSLSFDEEPGDAQNMAIACDVSHSAGYTKRYRLFAPPDTLGPKGTPVKTQLHGRGSTTTFLRRYLECNIFNVVLRNMDDDGNRGGMETITEAEIEELKTALDELNIAADHFLNYMGYEALPDIQKRDLAKARNAIKVTREKRAAARKAGELA
jgi:hypothetical protein